MIHSRISRLEEKRTKKQLILVTLGIIATIIFVVTVGIPLVVGGSVLLGNLKSRGAIADISDTAAPFPPTLSPMTSATNSAEIKLEGYGEPEGKLTVIVNGQEVKIETLGTEGTFSYSDIALDTGLNTIYATVTDAAGNESNPSEELTVTYKKGAPKLEVAEPTDGQTFGHNQQEITIRGNTDSGSQVRINERFVSVADDGSFTFSHKLSDGENTLTVMAFDVAGNETKLERKVTFTP
jgi:hypothetical protein